MFKKVTIAITTVLALTLFPTVAIAHEPRVYPNPPVMVDHYTASTPREAAESYSKTLASQYRLTHATALAIAETSAQRRSVVLTALSYLGTPYVLDGASHSGIDCSGLSMLAYASVGIGLVHYVPAQDSAAPVHLAAGHEQVGDLLVFDDEEHVGIYIGNGQLIEAPNYGIPTRIVSVNGWWSSTPYHVAKFLS